MSDDNFEEKPDGFNINYTIKQGSSSLYIPPSPSNKLEEAGESKQRG